MNTKLCLWGRRGYEHKVVLVGGGEGMNTRLCL